MPRATHGTISTSATSGGATHALLRLPGGNNSVVECDLAKVEVAGSNPVSRSNLETSRSQNATWHVVAFWNATALSATSALRRRLHSERVCHSAALSTRLAHSARASPLGRVSEIANLPRRQC